MSKKKTHEEILKELADGLNDSYLRWEYLLKHGGSDPFYADGVNMNLVRNHIIWYKKQIEEQLEENEYPKWYYRELPPEVDHNYMADPDGIRQDAKNTLIALQTCEDFLWLSSHAVRLTPTKENETWLRAALRVSELKSYIESDKLIDMRRYRNPDTWLDCLANARKNLSKYFPEERTLPEGQLSIFDLAYEV